MQTQRRKRSEVVTVHKFGKAYNTIFHPGFQPQFRFDRLEDAGEIVEESRGEENLYFTFTTDAGATAAGYCKCL